LTDETKIHLRSEVIVGGSSLSGTGVVWSSSNTKVAEVVNDGSGGANVVGKTAGTATITCTADDGSGKKATAKVTVITPASGVYVTAGKSMSQYFDRSIMGDKVFYLGYGANMPLSVKVGDAYGKPSVSKTNVTYEVGYFKDDNEEAGFVPFSESYQNLIKSKKWYLTCSGSKISFKNKNSFKADVKKDYEISSVSDYQLQTTYYIAVRVTATTTDGTVFRSVLPNTKLEVRWYNGSRYTVYNGAICNISRYGVGDYEVGSVYADGFIYNQFTVTSSNPDVASARVEYDEDYKSWDGGYMLFVNAKKKGTATITITSLDGTGKKLTYKVQVK
jgi:hypothetical protein